MKTTSQQSMTLLVTQRGAVVDKVVYCPTHLALTMQNIGAMRNGDCAYPSYRNCEVCEATHRADVAENAKI